MESKDIPKHLGPIIPTRRQMMTWSALALGGMAAASSEAWAAAPQSSDKPTATDSVAPIHQEVDFNATPHRIYDALIDSKKFAAFTGLPADIHPEAGGAFSCFDGVISGRNIELVPDVRIVQAWRVSGWAPGVYSMVKFELKVQGSGTRLIFDHTGFPEGTREHLDSGWKARYWDPLQKYLASGT